MENIITLRNIEKKYKGFKLDIPELDIPKGFSTAFIGENGAGKTTLLSIISGLLLNFKGETEYFGKYRSADEDNVRELMGCTTTKSYFMPHWKLSEVKEISQLLFDNFDGNRFDSLCGELAIDGEQMNKKVSDLSDGNKMRLMIAGILARDTRMLIMDEPASPLDPVMRDKLCDMIRDYISEGEGEKSVIFSTHNISDMEHVTDYAVIFANGRIVEKGFVEDLKEKYILVKGEPEDIEAAGKILYSITKGKYGFEGICLADDLDKLAGMDISTESATLHQISVAVMKANSSMK